ATHKSIPFTSLRYGVSMPDKIKSRLLYWHNLKKILKEYQPQAILMDDMHPSATKKLKRYAKRHSVLLIHDSVEWYSKEQFKGGSLATAYIQKNRINKRIIDRSCRVIAISSFLQNHFSSRGITCVNIPIVTSDEDLVQEKLLQPKLKFLYAGQPGLKDYLHVTLNAMALLSAEDCEKFEFHILGCTKEQLVDASISTDVLDRLGSAVVAHGRVKREVVLEHLKSADFTILMRSPVLRYAKAGFPTKMVESLSHSTPIIANLTSDMHLYLVDGVNSLIVEDCTAEALAKVLKKAIGISVAEREQMCRSAFATAADMLHYRQFIPAMEEILK
ncbi:MAG: glycosyltransferase, partial [Clostridia bacterium]|nr:glycosyltransferase [Clostridia bacterium]